MVADNRDPPPPASTIILFPSQDKHSKPERKRGHLSCKMCQNKTFVAEYLNTLFPALRCAACGVHQDFIGFTQGRSQ
jgi:hypothetical protein